MPCEHGIRHFCCHNAETELWKPKKGNPDRTSAAVDCTWYGGAMIGVVDALAVESPSELFALGEKTKNDYLLTNPTIRNAKAIVRSTTRQR